MLLTAKLVRKMVSQIWIGIHTTKCVSKKSLLLIIVTITAFVSILLLRYLKRPVPSGSPTSPWIGTETNSLFDTPFCAKPWAGMVDEARAVDQRSDSISWSAECVTREEIRQKLLRCNQASETRDERCQAVHSNPDSFWRSQHPDVKKSHEEDFRRMDLASSCCAFNYSALILNNPRDPPFPWELDYLCSSGPLLNMADTAHASKSTVRLLGVTRDGKRREGTGRFIVGDHVSLEVVVRNGRGQVQKLGGDSVHVWLKTPDLGASIAADVTDLKNGSYLAISLLAWAGRLKVKTAIAQTRDLIRTVTYIQRYFSSSHWFTALWQNGNYSEATPCSPYPALPAFSAKEICNLTHRNGGFPWFCGKPIKIELGVREFCRECSDYVSSRKIDLPASLPLTKPEEELIEQTASKQPILVPGEISFDVQAKSGTLETSLPMPGLPCNQRDLTETFTETDQSGYLFGHQWRPFACRLPNITSEFLKQCLKDTQVLFLGDSNSRLQMDILTTFVKWQNKIPRGKENWHAPLRCVNETLNTSIKYFPPMHPFYGSIGEQVKPEVLISAVEKMDAIPATGKYIVHLHNFLHFMPFHLGLAEQRLRLLRAAAKRLLARNPQVIVVYQSAFSSYDHIMRNKHKLDTQLVELQRSIMCGLGPRAMFVRTLPLTLASENNNSHPEISDQFMLLSMGHICGR